MKNEATKKSCSFCGDPGEDRKLAGGLGAMICANCAAYYHTTMSSPDRIDAALVPPWLRMSDVELLSQLPRIARTGEQAGEFLIEWVEMCRRQGLSWASIGKALGTTRQTAWERFSRKVDELQQFRAAAEG